MNPKGDKMTVKTPNGKGSAQILAWGTIKEYKSILPPHSVSSSLYIQGKLYFYECLPWKNNLFCLWIVCENSRRQPIWLHFQSLEGMASPLQDYQEGISRRCLWQPSLWSMAGTLPREAYSPERLQLGALSWNIFWKQHISSWRCSFRSNKLSGAYIEVLLEKDLCPTAQLLLFKSIKHNQ